MNTKVDKKEDKVCFVIMPIADVQGYDAGHFGRVYEHLLKPAIVKAGYTPVRADDAIKTDYIVVGIIQKIVESDMVICDFSARNPNVMYELGVRHAFNKPVVLIKDRDTDKVFDIQGLRYTEYDHTLRIDSVHKDISKISEAIRETANNKSDNINSVVQLAGIKAAEVPATHHVTAETQLVLSAISSIEKMLMPAEYKNNKLYFSTSDNVVTFHDETTCYIGDTVFNHMAKPIGKLAKIFGKEERIIIHGDDGYSYSYKAHDISSKELSGLPF